MKRQALLLILSLCFNKTFSQDITNTLGSSGSFIVKDSTNTFLKLDQLTGYLSIDKSLVIPNTTSSSIGVIYRNTDRFIHNYTPLGAEGWNTFVGINSGNFTMTAPSSYNSSYNTAVGYQTLKENITGYFNTAIGFNSLTSNKDGYWNTAIGSSSLVSNTSGYLNTSVGLGALYYNTTGYENTAVGVQSLRANINGYQNTAVGFKSLYSNTGIFNTALGWYSLYSNTFGARNTALGWRALMSNSTGNSNVAIGEQALYNNIEGIYNTAVGSQTLFNNTGVGSTTGSYNTAIGMDAGSTITNGSNLTCLGFDAEPTSATAQNQITLGNSVITSLRCNVTTITSLSDARDKKNIKDLDLGIDFLMKIKPRQFNWDKREWYESKISDGSKMKEEPTAGFIAQELDEAQREENVEWLNLVLKDNPEKWEATPGNLLPVIVKAVQEIKSEKDAEIEILEEENQNLKNEKDKEIAELKAQISKYEEFQTMLVTRLEKLEPNEQIVKVNFVRAEEHKQ